MTSRSRTGPDGALTRRPLSTVATRLLARARQEWAQRQFAAAEQSLQSVLALAPDDPDATRMLGMVLQRRGDHARAAACFRRVLAVWPEDPDLRIGLGIALFEQGEVDEAVAHLRDACRFAPDSASAWFNLGEALQRQAYALDALEPLQRALELDPAHVSARLSLAKAQASLGRADAAVANFHGVLQRDPDNAEAWYWLSLNTAGFDATETAHLARAFARTDLPATAHEMLGFTFAKALESQGDYARAFEIFRQANAAQRGRLPWNAAREHATVEAIRQAFSNPMPAQPEAGFGGEAILIASMPRSGSTLVEHILASHPDVEGANEIKDMRQVLEGESKRRGAAFPAWVGAATAKDWRRLGQAYLDRTARWRQTRPRFTDKNLMNWHLVGAALAMLPAARVVIVRRDPVETCVACYRQCFTAEAAFTCDLDATADYCIDFLRLTRFWLERWPGRVFDLAYEALVADPEAMVRRLLDFCGLRFEPACLEFHKTSRAVLTPSAAQVRQPLRRDTARSARYGDKLDHLRQRFLDAGVPAS